MEQALRQSDQRATIHINRNDAQVCSPQQTSHCSKLSGRLRLVIPIHRRKRHTKTQSIFDHVDQHANMARLHSETVDRIRQQNVCRGGKAETQHTPSNRNKNPMKILLESESDEKATSRTD